MPPFWSSTTTPTTATRCAGGSGGKATPISRRRPTAGGARAPRDAAVRSRAPRHHDAGLDGFQVLERLKAHATWRHIPVIMISALSEFESVVRCIELGAEDYLQKPFNSVLLRARVRASLERKRLHDREAAHLAEIDRQRQRADRLLHAILPGPAVAELKAADRITPRRFEEVARAVRRRARIHPLLRPPPARACGRQSRSTCRGVRGHYPQPWPREDQDRRRCLRGDREPAGTARRFGHGVPCAASALAEAARRTPANWQMRVGIHLGPVAGVVGSTKFSFDLWGDTVNVAQRLSAYGARRRST